MHYKYELHCHTNQVSKCSDISAENLVRTYIEKGYSGAVITDHYSSTTFSSKGLLRPQKHTDFFLSGYKCALEEAGNNFTVLPGMEIRFYHNFNDYLVFGLNENFLRTNGNLLKMNIKSFYDLADKNGMIVVQAHPFRQWVYRANPKYLHGAEIYNGKDENNLLAEEWAKENKISIRTGGSDCHRASGAALSGIITDRQIKTNNDLLNILRSNEFEIIRKDEE